jgi:beta-barrel assembly-enhancing protease
MKQAQIMKNISMNKLLIALFVSAGLLASSAYALDLGKMLEDAAKQKVEEAIKGKDDSTQKTAEPGVENKPAEVPVAAPIPAPAPTNTTPAANTGAATTSTSGSVTPAPVEAAPSEIKKLEPEKPAFNWKSPSKEEEIALGREITGSLLGAAPLVKDAALQQYVNKVGRWVASQSERDNLPWKFGVIDSADLNAFAMPGGYVLITKGLYAKLQNEAQLASVLGHEIAHVVKKHQLKVLQKQQLLGYGAGKISDLFGKKDKLAKKVVGTGAEISARGLDKDAEFEADRMGMVLAARAGYDAFSLAEVLQTMSQTNKNDSSVALLFKTHPAPDERLAKLSDAAGSSLDNVKAGKTLENRMYKLK